MNIYYREYKEALRQQRNHDNSSIYRTLNQSPSTPDSKLITPNLKSFSNHHTIPKCQSQQQNINNNRNSSPISPSSNRNNSQLYDDSVFKKPIQKVTPSRNMINGNIQVTDTNKTSIQLVESQIISPSSSSLTSEAYAYIKPNSPLKGSDILGHNTIPTACKDGGVGVNNTSSKLNQTKNSNRTVTWNRKMDESKMSFTMRREIDKQKEELELIEQLKTVSYLFLYILQFLSFFFPQIIETKLKMTLPQNISPALMDGVVLCHLANHIRPRSVASIHVPSPTVVSY